MAGDKADRPDNPNQELVRPDGSGPADEGSGGSTAEPEPKKAPAKKASAKATDEPDPDEAPKED